MLTSTPAMRSAADNKPLPSSAARPKSQLTRDTRTGEVYWCDFSPLNWPPEFDYQHLVVIVRGGKIERDINVVMPLTKADQSENPHGYRLAHNPNRLTPRRLADTDLREISQRLRKALGTFLSLGISPDSGDQPEGETKADRS